MKAMWNNQIIAESKFTIFVENNHYFPIESVNKKFLKSNTTKSMCWKGEATYFDILVDEEINKDSA